MEERKLINHQEINSLSLTNREKMALIRCAYDDDTIHTLFKMSQTERQEFIENSLPNVLMRAEVI